MQISVEIPDELAASLAAPGQDPSRAALEALALEAYRQRRISAYQLRMLLGITEVDPIVWTRFCRSLDGAAGCPGGGPKAAIHSGLDSALGSHPCVALSSYQALPFYGNRG